MEIKDIITTIGFIGGRDAIIIEHINIIDSRTIEVYVNVSRNSLCDFVDNSMSAINLKFVFNGVMKFQLYDYEMFENNIKGKGQTVSSIREIVKSTYSLKGLHHIIIIATTTISFVIPVSTFLNAICLPKLSPYCSFSKEIRLALTNS
jgi:hypothetical protein